VELGLEVSVAKATLTITAVSGSSTPYTVTVTEATTNVAVGDHFGAKVADGSGGVWDVTAKTATTLTVADTLTEENGGVYGIPVVGNGWYGTPSTNTDLSQPPFDAKGWDAAWRRNQFLTDATPPHGSCYYAADVDSETAIAAQDTYTVLANTATIGPLASSFDIPSGHRLRYTGTHTRVFKVSVGGRASGAGTHDYRFRIVKTGSTSVFATREDGEAEVALAVASNTTLAMFRHLSLATNDYIEVWAANPTNGDNLTVERLFIIAEAL